ncbi:MAG: methionine synthase [Bacteroidales bacterium]|nr:methionine synthase [Bacteroidales bacterium]
MLLMDLRQALRDRILILDGAMGTMLQRHGLSGNSEPFNLTHPDIVRSIHRAYIDAGADIISTNTFGANAISQADYGCSAQAREFARAGAALARAEADAAPRKVWVAGSMGPSGKSLTLPQDLGNPAWRPVSFDEMAAAYAEQVRGLVEGGADALLLETCFDALNTKAALYAISNIPEAAALPLLISVSVADRSGRTLTGQTLEAFYRSVQHARPLTFGLNCSLGAADLAPLVADIAAWADCAVSCYPNAGLPNEMGAYDEKPEQTAAALRQMAASGLVNLVGGCCGTTPEHIAAIAAAVHGISPRAIPAPNARPYVSGLEAVCLDVRQSRFTNIGERTNVAGSRKFAKLIATGEYDTALQVAAGQIEGGAAVIDINMDDAMLDSTVEMEKFTRHIAGDPAVSKAALMIDSSHWETLLAGLKNAQGRCIVNSISLKEGEEVFLKKAREIRRLGASVVVMAFDEQGQATTYARKIEICGRAYRLLTEQAGYQPWEIIFDVNVLSVGTGIPEHARYAVDFIEAVRWIKLNLPGTMCSGGISNLSFAFRGNNPVREAMHTAFLFHAVEAGLDMGIVNPGMLLPYDAVEPGLLRAVEDVILDRDAEATERLIALAQQMAEAGQKNPGNPGGSPEKTGDRTEKGGESCPVSERLVGALVAGGSPTLQQDLMEALQEKGRAVDVIEGPLMDGMARVGERFAAGKMFLPQVVKSAKVMRDAVEILQPYMGASEDGSGKPRILLATVQGDVHDIGKNILGIVLRCNGFEVTDLGVMVPRETILAQAEAIRADIIGVSGLITPSLHQMEELCREMASRGLCTPLLIGGATTSALHTAVKLAPLYDHVFYAPDASASAVLAGRLLSDRTGTETEEHRKQEEIRALYKAGDAGSQSGMTKGNGHSGRQSRHSGLDPESHPFPADTYLRGAFFESIPCRELSIAEVLPYFDWKLFYAIWGVKHGDDTTVQLNEDAIERLEVIKREGLCRIRIAARFDACHADRDTIVAPAWRLPMLRQDGPDGRSLADFVAPGDYGFDSPAGMFAISVHRDSPVKPANDEKGKPAKDEVVIPGLTRNLHPSGCDCPACSMDYDSLLDRSLRLTLAEAASGWLDAQLEKQLKDAQRDGKPVPATPVKIVKPAAGYASCPDHSLKRDILALLPGGDQLDIRLTESCAMIPDASICGLVFAHPAASYPEIRRLPAEALDAYAAARGFNPEDARLFLSHLR